MRAGALRMDWASQLKAFARFVVPSNPSPRDQPQPYQALSLTSLMVRTTIMSIAPESVAGLIPESAVSSSLVVELTIVVRLG